MPVLVSRPDPALPEVPEGTGSQQQCFFQARQPWLQGCEIEVLFVFRDAPYRIDDEGAVVVELGQVGPLALVPEAKLVLVLVVSVTGIGFVAPAVRVPEDPVVVVVAAVVYGVVGCCPTVTTRWGPLRRAKQLSAARPWFP